jgi:hypothetical protein
MQTYLATCRNLFLQTKFANIKHTHNVWHVNFPCTVFNPFKPKVHQINLRNKCTGLMKLNRNELFSNPNLIIYVFLYPFVFSSPSLLSPFVSFSIFALSFFTLSPTYLYNFFVCPIFLSYPSHNLLSSVFHTLSCYSMPPVCSQMTSYCLKLIWM